MDLHLTKEQFIHFVEQSGIFFIPEKHGFSTPNKDYVFPYLLVLLCTSGSGRAMIDMCELSVNRNDLSVIMPGHIIRPLDFTPDFTYALLAISPKMFSDLRLHTFSHDYEKFNYSPISSLTDEQATHLININTQLAAIASHTEVELPHRNKMLLAQMAVGYEFLNFYRREQDKQWVEKPHSRLFNRFCDLVVEHYRESREIQYYANLLNLTPKYFTKVIRETTGGISPGDWIEQYVIAQAKRLIETNCTRTLQEIAYMLGFSEPTSFYRYFKRITGMTAKEYRNQVLALPSS